jgi:hypothetical protein
MGQISSLPEQMDYQLVRVELSPVPRAHRARPRVIEVNHYGRPEVTKK